MDNSKRHKTFNEALDELDTAWMAFLLALFPWMPRLLDWLTARIEQLTKALQ